jgi:DNA polymerase-3 subunit epsilon
MRQIVLDTETTGINPREGNRIIEIGCVELLNRKLTGNNFHVYINPERESEEGALNVHGLTTEFLSDKPKFAAVAADLVEYVRGAEVIIHNAPFDIGFLDAELDRLGIERFEQHIGGVIDTLAMAKEMYPGKRNSLDALCDRYEISNAHRKLHGALLDAELLADVYLAMTRGQNSLAMDLEAGSSDGDAAGDMGVTVVMADIVVLAASADELAVHETVLASLDKEVRGTCVWRAPEANCP